MTAQELIETLSNVPGNTRVVVHVGKYGFKEAQVTELGFYERSAEDFRPDYDEGGGIPDAVLIRA
jgi:hypothetical protein